MSSSVIQSITRFVRPRLHQDPPRHGPSIKINSSASTMLLSKKKNLPSPSPVARVMHTTFKSSTEGECPRNNFSSPTGNNQTNHPACVVGNRHLGYRMPANPSHLKARSQQFTREIRPGTETRRSSGLCSFSVCVCHKNMMQRLRRDLEKKRPFVF